MFSSWGGQYGDVEFLYKLLMFGIVLWVHCGFTRPVLKLLPCLSKENCLHIGLSWWRIKGIIGSVKDVVTVGTFKIWSTYKAVVETDIPWILRVRTCLSVEYFTCTPFAYSCGKVFIKLWPSLFWLRADTVHIPLFVKLPAVCFHYFCYTHLYLNVLGNLRTNVQVKMQ